MATLDEPQKRETKAITGIRHLFGMQTATLDEQKPKQECYSCLEHKRRRLQKKKLNAGVILLSGIAQSETQTG